MKVLKFGGTSLGTPQRMKSIWKIVSDQDEDRTIVVLSAVSGTTNLLQEIAEACFLEQWALARKLLRTLGEKHLDFAVELLENEESIKRAKQLIDQSCQTINKRIEMPFFKPDSDVVMAQGEVLSSGLFQVYLQEQNENVALLSALNFMRLDAKQEPDMAFIMTHLEKEMNAFPSCQLFVTQGYICRSHDKAIANLQRGGSDYTASLIGAAVQADEIQIWTDIDGLHNNDPRFVNQTVPVKQLSFDEAAELAYFGAKILHPKSIHPAKKANIPVRLLDTTRPEQPGTLIFSTEEHKGEIVAISAKDGITAVRIQSSRMLMAYGFLRQVFEVFEHHQTSIDMITTSEVAVSLTIDQTKNLPQIITELQQFGKVDCDFDQAIVCVVGDFSGASHGHATVVSEALKHLPVRMISYGGSEHNISMLLPQQYKVEALRSLHYRFF